MRSVCFHAGLEVADRDDFIPQPDHDGEGAGSMLQDGVGAVVGAVERRDDATMARQRGRVAARLAAWPAARNRISAWAKKKLEHPKFFNLVNS
jgi:hypothetical protein